MIHNLFSVPIYLEKLNLNNKKILNHCLKQKKHLKTAFKSNIGGWQSPALNGRHQPLEKLITEILTMGETFRKNLNFKNPLKLANMWININGYGHNNIPHVHPNSILSGVYYVKTFKDSGNIVFYHPGSSLMEYDWQSFKIEKYTPSNACTWKFESAQGYLFMFPSWLLHRVDNNLSKKERVSISFNLVD